MSFDLHITLAYAAPGIEALMEITLSEGAVVADAVTASGMLEELQLDVRTISFAIYGQRAQLDTPLRDGDRVELTRPLFIDPKTARRKRAHTHPLAPATNRPKGAA